MLKILFKNYNNNYYNSAREDSGTLIYLCCINSICPRCLQTANTHTHTHPFNDPLSGTTQVSRYQKDKTNLDFTEARDSECQWHQLGHMQVCTSLQTDNHASTPLLSFFTGRMLFLPPNQQRQSTEGCKIQPKNTCADTTWQTHTRG